MEEQPYCQYKASIKKLLAYVGLTGYGTPEARMPWRSEAEEAQIQAHYSEAAEEHQKHIQALERKGLSFHKTVPPRLQEALDASIGPLEKFKEHSPLVTSPKPTIYLSPEESIEWKSFLRSIPPKDRHQTIVKRTLSLSFWMAHRKNICVYCWLPAAMCACSMLQEYSNRMSRIWDASAQKEGKKDGQYYSSITPLVKSSMVLHAEEVLRGTNSGHIAAFILHAPLLVWGVPKDDQYIQQLSPIEEVAPGDQQGPSRKYFNVCLYPASSAHTFPAFVSQIMDPGKAFEEEKGNLGVNKVKNKESLHPLGNEASPRTKALDSGTNWLRKQDHFRGIHLFLLDSTWRQALSLSRHIPACVPRVLLQMDENYESLFVALRKRTRNTGVSTLEATNMAIEQCFLALGLITTSAESSRCLREAMMSFVNLKCLLKSSDIPFQEHQMKELEDTHRKSGCLGEPLMPSVSELKAKHSEARSVANSALYDDVQKRVNICDGEFRELLLPPVLNYCYVCDRTIGWHRMPEHVQGKRHCKALVIHKKAFFATLSMNHTDQLNTAMEDWEKQWRVIPSAYSSTVIVPDFERPQRGAADK